MRVGENPGRDLLRLFVWYPLRLVAERLPFGAALALYRSMGRLHQRLSRGRTGRIAQAAARIKGRQPRPADVNHAAHAFDGQAGFGD